jgi:RNA polymerase sigma factor (sigma-70 family)
MLSLDAEQLSNDPRLAVSNFADELDLDGEGDIWEKRMKLLPKALSKLTDKQRQIAIMVFCDKKTQRVIARELGISDRAVRYHLEAIEKKFEKFRKTAS